MEVKLISWTKDPIGTVAKAASMCYASEPSRDVVRGCIKSGHTSVLEMANYTFEIRGVSRSCYDGETEILTRDGWKLFKDLSDDEVVATLNKCGEVEWHKINERISYNYSGKMHKYKSQNVDLFVTENHNMFYRKQDSILKRQDYSTFLTPSNEITCNKIVFDKRFNLINDKLNDTVTIHGYSYEKKNNCGGHYTKTLSDIQINRTLFLKFLAWYLSDGSTYYFEKENKYVISISQAETERNIKNNTVNDIKNIIHEMGFNCRYDGHNIKFTNRVLGKFLKQLGKSYDKYIPYDIFSFFDKESAKIFIDEYFRGDGSIDKNGCGKLYTSSKVLRDQLYTLCFMAGYTCSYMSRGTIGDKVIIKGVECTQNHIQYVLNVSMGKRNSCPYIQISDHRSEIYVNNFPVYCVEVPNHIIFVRRNGKAVWCGNCLAQLTRHRHASYAVESQRYVKYDDVDWVTTGLPFVLSPVIEQQADVSLEAYKDMVANKHKAEDARAVLPNCMPTNLVMTMNLRAMMNFMHERLCSLAQTEIRILATEMKKCVIACPDHTEEDADIIKSILVSKCQAREIPYCTERKWCGRVPNVETVKRLIADGHQFQNTIETFASGKEFKELEDTIKLFYEKFQKNS